jgi:hypothetical protein
MQNVTTDTLAVKRNTAVEILRSRFVMEISVAVVGQTIGAESRTLT